MSRNKIIFLVFAFVALAQIAVPAMMIFEREHVLNEGREYKFRSAPRDPYDPFRGKYITMQYVSNQTQVSVSEEWESGETVYVQFMEDEDGFAIIESVSKSAPDNTSDYLKTTVQYFDNYDYEEEGTATLSIYYPFDRFYMEESKAFEAEMAYNETRENDWVEEEGWDSYNWSEDDWKRYIQQTNELYEQLQDTSTTIWNYSSLLEEYQYLVYEISNQSQMYFDGYHLSELALIQNTINEFDYVATFEEEEIVEEELIEVQQSVAYSLVCIKNGRAVLKDVMIDDIGIKDVVISNREEEIAH
ncbi:MAG: hypothetical protein GQ574_11930 [Crocinitomix sp.]|nr:hypothetical protein [Crocinitomix sp.]